MKHNAISIKLTRAEGLIIECGKPVTVTGENVWKQAKSILYSWSSTAPENGGYDKCDFVVTFDDQETYTGRCDIKHYTCTDPDLDVAEHITSFMEWHAGLTIHPWCGEDKYKEYLVQNGGEKVMQEYKDFLDSYQIGEKQ